MIIFKAALKKKSTKIQLYMNLICICSGLRVFYFIVFHAEANYKSNSKNVDNIIERILLILLRVAGLMFLSSSSECC